MILLLDNHDSFTWNLVHYLRALGAEVRVARSDAIRVEDALGSGADGFLISPGPGRPEDAGISMALVKACADAGRPVLGVCLGHQAIGAAFGARIVHAPRVMHGKTSQVTHDRSGLFAQVPSPLVVARYHSLTIEAESLPAELSVAARAEDGSVQAIRHAALPLWGLQFHPESIASEHGPKTLGNWLGAVRWMSGSRSG